MVYSQTIECILHSIFTNNRMYITWYIHKQYNVYYIVYSQTIKCTLHSIFTNNRMYITWYIHKQ